ncbi:hypothetical protein HDU96_008957 [Phlyctochytrium bullatum]|nr:hypothetical protein HDU96_008957 [Phlyctochytrium bullatum]
MPSLARIVALALAIATLAPLDLGASALPTTSRRRRASLPQLFVPPVEKDEDVAGSTVVPHASDLFDLAKKFVASKSSIPVDDALQVQSFKETSDLGITHIYLQETHNGIPIVNAVSNVNVDSQGNVILAQRPKSSGASIVRRSVDPVPSEPKVSPIDAFVAFAKEADLIDDNAPPPALKLSEDGKNILGASEAGIAVEDVPVALKYYMTPAGSLELVWEFNVQRDDAWYNALSSATDSKAVAVDNWMADSDVDLGRRDDDEDVTVEDVPVEEDEDVLEVIEEDVDVPVVDVSTPDDDDDIEGASASFGPKASALTGGVQPDATRPRMVFRLPIWGSAAQQQQQNTAFNSAAALLQRVFGIRIVIVPQQVPGPKPGASTPSPQVTIAPPRSRTTRTRTTRTHVTRTRTTRTRVTRTTTRRTVTRTRSSRTTTKPATVTTSAVSTSTVTASSTVVPTVVPTTSSEVPPTTVTSAPVPTTTAAPETTSETEAPSSTTAETTTELPTTSAPETTETSTTEAPATSSTTAAETSSSSTTEVLTSSSTTEAPVTSSSTAAPVTSTSSSSSSVAPKTSSSSTRSSKTTSTSSSAAPKTSSSSKTTSSSSTTLAPKTTSTTSRRTVTRTTSSSTSTTTTTKTTTTTTTTSSTTKTTSTAVPTQTQTPPAPGEGPVVYRALPYNFESLAQGAPVLSAPVPDPKGSPNGWHANPNNPTTNGANVNARDASNRGYPSTGRTAGGQPVFDYTFDPASDPRSSVDAAVVNVFKLTNEYHDILYNYGFTEKTGAFQAEDPVLATIQSSSGTNNANFATPPDGRSGKMNMFLFTATNPDRDGDMDHTVVIHELTHGLSTRLTGSRFNPSCLSSTESGGMGEGWSDMVAVLFSARASHTRDTDRLVGSYVTGNTRRGIRSMPYSTSNTRNTHTYASIASMSEVHRIGEVWASILFEAYWNVVEMSGFEADLLRGAKSGKGNTDFLQILVDSLMLQGCNPTFVAARDAFIKADQTRFGGKYRCALWKGFAKRGLGVNAANRVNDFSVPQGC